MIHKTRDITIKKGKIDLLMIPTVRYLNSVEETYTEWCCQGDASSRPYVIFYCNSQPGLIQIVKKFEGVATIQVEFWGSSLRYYLQFNGPKNLKLSNRPLNRKE